MANKPKVFIAKINLTYKNESRLASIYDDGTAVFDTGETMKLSQAQIDKIKAKKQEAEEKALAERMEREARLREEEQRRREEEQRRREAEDAAAREAARQAVHYTQPPNYSDYEEEVEEEIYDSTEEDSEYGYSNPYGNSYENMEIQPRGSGRKQVVKVVLSTIGLFVVCGGIMFGSFYLLDNHLTRVSVAQFSTSVAKDQQLTPDNLERLKMPESVYRELTNAAPGDVVLWEDAQSLVGQYAAMDAIAGQYVTTDYVTDSVTENLWKADMDSEQEMVNLDFDRFDIDEIYPGSHISIRAVVDMEDSKTPKVMSIDEAANIGTEQEAKERAAELAAAQAAREEAERQAQEEAEAEAEEQAGSEEAAAEEATEESTESSSESASESSEIPETAPGDSRDTFRDVVVVDLKNNYNDSIFDLYLGLASMTTEDRQAYLTERAESSNANAYRESLTPTVLVLALEDEQARNLSVVKNMDNATLEFASIPSSNYDSTDEQHSLLMKFKEVDRDIREIFSAARTK